MATTADPDTKPAPRKAASRSRKTGEAKAAEHKPGTPKRTSAKRAADAANQAADSVKAAAEKTIEASHVPDAAKAVAAKARSAKSSLSRATASKPAKPGGGAKRRSSASRSVGTGAALGVAAAGLAAGLLANIGRKAAVQAPSVLAGDWLEALKAEHKAALALLDKLGKSAPEQPAKRAMLLIQLKHALGKHAFTEENAIYPALRDWGDKADADALNHQHGYVKQYLYDLEKMGKDDAGFGAKVADFRADLEKHIREEEDKVFPPFHQGLTEEQNKALTALANKEGFKLA